MIHCKVVTPTGLYKEMDTEILNVVNTNGEMGILPNHVPLVTTLVISKMSTIENGVRQVYSMSGGLLYFEDNIATILTDSIENRDEIDLERAEAAKQRAEQRLANKEMAIDVERAKLALSRALNRIRVKG